MVSTLPAEVIIIITTENSTIGKVLTFSLLVYQLYRKKKYFVQCLRTTRDFNNDDFVL